MEKIEVRYSRTSFGSTVPVYHKYILYIDMNGVQFYACRRQHSMRLAVWCSQSHATLCS